MTPRALSCICLAALSLTACASPQAPRGQMSTEQLALGDSQQTYARATEEERNRLYCHREVQTGSNRPVRICVTLAQRARMQADAQALTDNMNQRTSLCGDNPAGSAACGAN